MRNLVTAILCLSLSAWAVAQTSSGASSAGSQATTPQEPTATIETTDGNITCTLFPDKAPLTVANFIGLATGKKAWKDPKTGQMMHTPLYDGTICHRVIPEFMIQCGDPAGNGTGGPGYDFKDEFSPDLTFDQPGRLAMANSGPNTNGSQFFITEVPTPHLNGKHTIFGQCEDLDVVKKIARLASDPRTDRPFNPVMIKHVVIVNPPHPVTTHKPATTTSAGSDDIQRALDKASASNTVEAYRSFLNLFKSDDPAPSTDSKNQTARSQLYWAAHARIEKLLSSKIINEGAGRRFCIKDIQPKEDSITGTITVNGTVPSTNLALMETLYPGDKLVSGPVSTNGFSMGPPLGNKSIIRFIGKVPIGAWTIYGDSKEPLSFLLLKPYGFVYLDGRGTVANGNGTPVSLPISSPSHPKH